MNYSKLISAALAGCLALSLAACGNTENKTEAPAEKNDAVVSEAKKGVTAFVGTNIFEESLDPIKGGMSHGYPFINNALLRVGPDSHYVGDLATSWTVSGDALTYTFMLREDVTFSDGSPFTAEDVIFTYNQVMENPAINEYVDLSRLESVEATDDYQVVFHLLQF